ncbi:MAG: restriction endonuclease subunit S [Lachnospiraceae bacterium]|nr:restriction endonuclease subunit S [Lachnospiraceae bacterium]
MRENRIHNLPYEKVGKNEPVCIADEVPFEIPDTWEWARWGTLSESIQYGYNAPAQGNGRIKMVRISDIQDNSIIWETVPYCDIKESEIDVYRLKPNDILFARTGGTVGKSCLVKEVPEDAIYAGYLIRTRYSNHLCPQYLKFFMESELYWSQLRDGTIATAQPNCNGKTLGNMLVPIPPIQEQIRIIEKLNVVMPYVIEYSVAHTKSKQLHNIFPDQLKKSILQKAVQGRLVPQDENDEPASTLLERIRAEKQALIKVGKIKKDKNESVIFRRDNSHYEKRGSEEVCIDDELGFDIPISWELVRLNDIGVYRKGPFGSALTKGMFVKKGADTVKVYEQKNAIKKDHALGDYYITRKYYDEKMKSFSVKPGDIIVSCAGTIGETYILPENIEDGIINQALMRMEIFAPINIDYFLLYFDYVLKESAKANSKGSAIKNIPPFEIFKKLLLPLPPLPEQMRIVERVRELENVCDCF